jgi:hypothetical protein
MAARAVLYDEGTDSLSVNTLFGYDQRNPHGMHRGWSFGVIKQATRAVESPTINGAPCEHGWCGLPRWATTPHSGTPMYYLHLVGPTHTQDVGRGYSETFHAPIGEGADAYDWYLSAMLHEFTEQLDTLGLSWAAE